MVEKEKKEIKGSEKFDLDVIDVFEYGEEIFGYAAARTFVNEIFNRFNKLDEQ